MTPGPESDRRERLREMAETVILDWLKKCEREEWHASSYGAEQYLIRRIAQALEEVSKA